MVDDAAGAVRRTPRPAPEPDVDELVNQTQMLGFGVERGVATLSLKPPHEIVVAWVDAARAMLGDAPNYSETRIDFPTEKAEMEVSAAGEFDRFVFTVQRAGRLTPHEARRKAETDRDLALWLHAELQHKLTLPCGDCHPCNNWADETWRRAGRKPPHVVTWEDKLAETRGLYARLDDAIKLIEEMSNHLRQEPALTIGVETRLAALQGDQPAAGSKYRDVELVYWRGRAESAEQRLKDAANFYPDVPPEPPVGTRYSYPDGSTAWVRREDGWHCGRTEPCRNCPCEWQEAWDFGIRDPRLTRILGDQPSEQPRPLLPPDDPCQDLRCRRVDGRCVGMHCAHCGEPCGAQGHTCSTDAAEPTGEADRG